MPATTGTTARKSPARTASRARRSSAWPPKYNLFGVWISAVTYADVVEAVISAAREHRSAVAGFFAVHAVITSSRDAALREKVNEFDMIAPDGQPVRWALNLLYRTGLPSNIRGSDAMWQICKRAAKEQVAVYLYGGSPTVLDKLVDRLESSFPNLQIAGAESPPFRPLTAEEDQAVVERINSSGAGLVFIGLGCPKQDFFAAAHRDRIEAVQLCVGAAFDFHAGVKKTAPVWMQRTGFEWFHRLCHEPSRLWRRYLVTNSLFLRLLTAAWFRQKFTRSVNS